MSLHDFIKTLGTSSIEELEKEIQSREMEFNPYPLDVFHDRLKPYISAFENEYKFPKEFIGTALISAYSTCIGTAYRASTNGKDSVPLGTWSIQVGIPSSGKSFCTDKIMEPITKIAQELNIRWEEATSGLSEEQKNKMSMKEIVIREVVLATLVRSVIPSNPKGVVKTADEVMEWINGMTQQGRKEGLDESFWLSTWNGRGYPVRRSNNYKVMLDRPFVNLLGGIQPSILWKLFGNDRDSNGFIFRILFGLDTMNMIPKVNSEYVMPDEIQKPHFDLCNALYFDLPVENTNHPPKLCIASPGANKMFNSWRNKLIDNINKEKDLSIKEAKAGFMGKMSDYVMRFAAIIKITDAYLDHQSKGHFIFNQTYLFDEQVMTRAIKLGEYYLKSGQMVYEIVKKTTEAPYSAVQLAALVSKGWSMQQIAKYIYNDDSKKGKQKAWRAVTKAMKEYPKLFKANVK